MEQSTLKTQNTSTGAEPTSGTYPSEVLEFLAKYGEKPDANDCIKIRVAKIWDADQRQAVSPHIKLYKLMLGKYPKGVVFFTQCEGFCLNPRHLRVRTSDRNSQRTSTRRTLPAGNKPPTLHRVWAATVNASSKNNSRPQDKCANGHPRSEWGHPHRCQPCARQLQQSYRAKQKQEWATTARQYIDNYTKTSPI